MASRRVKGSEYKYKGELNIPISWTGPRDMERPHTILSEAVETPDQTVRLDAEHAALVEAAKARRSSELARKLDILFSTFPMIEKGDFVMLAISLAERHVPGCRVEYDKPKRGAKQHWTFARLRDLWKAAEELRKISSLPNSAVAGRLKKQDRFRIYDVRTIQNRLSEADKLARLFGRDFLTIDAMLGGHPAVQEIYTRIIRPSISVKA